MNDLMAEFVRRGLTQTTVARRVGISRGHLSDVLHGRRGMTERLARDIARATGIAMSDFVPDREEVTA
jgi:transcriptional regulator with XRE-family HTH domain